MYDMKSESRLYTFWSSNCDSEIYEGTCVHLCIYLPTPRIHLYYTVIFLVQMWDLFVSPFPSIPNSLGVTLETESGLISKMKLTPITLHPISKFRPNFVEPDGVSRSKEYTLFFFHRNPPPHPMKTVCLDSRRFVAKKTVFVAYSSVCSASTTCWHQILVISCCGDTWVILPWSASNITCFLE